MCGASGVETGVKITERGGDGRCYLGIMVREKELWNWILERKGERNVRWDAYYKRKRFFSSVRRN
jgi:hypothetical protein